MLLWTAWSHGRQCNAIGRLRNRPSANGVNLPPHAPVKVLEVGHLQRTLGARHACHNLAQTPTGLAQNGDDDEI